MEAFEGRRRQSRAEINHWESIMNHRILTIVAALFCASLIETADAAEPITLRYGQNATSAGSLSSLPLTVAQRKGFFVRE